MSRVLIAEDSPAIRLLLIRRLESAGHEVIAMPTGDEALEMIRNARKGSKPDVILLDAMMPGTSGADVLKSLKLTDPEIPVMVVSAVTGLSSSTEWEAAEGHVAKPIDFDDLLGRIEDLTSGPPRP